MRFKFYIIPSKTCIDVLMLSSAMRSPIIIILMQEIAVIYVFAKVGGLLLTGLLLLVCCCCCGFFLFFQIAINTMETKKKLSENGMFPCKKKIIYSYHVNQTTNKWILLVFYTNISKYVIYFRLVNWAFSLFDIILENAFIIHRIRLTFAQRLS